MGNLDKRDCKKKELTMADLEVIAPEKTTTITFSLEPAYNIMSTLHLLCGDVEDFGGWIQQITAKLSPEQLENNSALCSTASACLEGLEWPSFEGWLEYLVEMEPLVIHEKVIDYFLLKSAKYLKKGIDELPTAEDLLADREIYMSLIERVVKQKGHKFERTEHEASYELMKDPHAMKDRMINHLREMWEEYLAPEWERNLPMLRESIVAFESLDYSGKSTTERMLQIVARESLPREWESLLADIDEVIFIPSAHIGPYLMLIHHSETTARIVFGARVPKGAQVSSPALHRSELLMRLNTLADDTRLQILELVIQEGELGAKEIMDRLDLSQSTASRHLRQLSVTGYLTERRNEGAKVYRLNQDRINDTVDAIKGFVK
jgi:ArsR family transcriptional regulator